MVALNSALFQHLLKNQIYALELLGQAADVIETCHGKENLLLIEIRVILHLDTINEYISDDEITKLLDDFKKSLDA